MIKIFLLIDVLDVVLSSYHLPIYVCVRMYVYVCVCMYMCVCMCVYVCVCMYVCKALSVKINRIFLV
jgi:hypothetical protein